MLTYLISPNLSKLRLFGRHISRRMSVFTKKLNPLTGKDEWEIQDENYDFHQEIARSAFADMLHDSERNKKYYRGVQLAVDKMHSVGKKANVLDIGTGTGLLSMMAAKCGADTVIACEAFQPMAECAVKIIAENGFGDKIKVICKRSTELTVGEAGDMNQRANILVTEVFDTELIGEGAISTFSHAHRELLETDCIVVPSSSTVYAQIVESSLAQQWNCLNSLQLDGKVLLETPDKVASCPGAAAVHDIQLSQFSENNFKTIVSPTPVFRFDFSGKTILQNNESTARQLISESDGVAQVVFMWWDLTMDTEGDVILSCAPVWAHPSSQQGDVNAVDNIPWRDHWMQALYYLPTELSIKKGERITLISNHDEYSLWFGVTKDESATESPPPICSCGVHVAFARTRIGAMNDEVRNRKYLAALRSCVSKDITCLCLSNGTLLGLAAAKLGAKHVYCVEETNLSKQILNTYIQHNKLEDYVTILDCVSELKKLDQKIGLVFGEPHFLTTLLPWQNVFFWYQKQELDSTLTEDAIVMPAKATVWAMAVEFKDLWKIRAPLESVEGFKMTVFDELIERSSTISDCLVEAQPLWEYPCYPLSEPFPVLEFDFNETTVDKLGSGKTGDIRISGSGTCHGIVHWVDWDLDGKEEHVVTTGPIELPALGKKVVWDMHTRQGVYFLRREQRVDQTDRLKFSVQFEKSSGDVSFDFTFDVKNN